jgi:hypothetical protein
MGGLWTLRGTPQSAAGIPGSLNVKPESTRLHGLQAWDNLKILQSHIGKTTCSLGMLLQGLGIIATTYCSMSFETVVFNL